MKRTLALFLSIVIIFLFTSCSSVVNISDGTTAFLTYIYDNKNINTELTDEESNTIRQMFNGKELYNDSPSCGFSENISIRFGNYTYCIANDRCGVIKVGFQYFNISDNERDELEKILKSYGADFPCV